MTVNSDTNAFNRYLKRFIDEHIKTFPTRSFSVVEDYESMIMLMLNGWRLLKTHPCSSSGALQKLESFIEMIERFNGGIERPLQLTTLRSIKSHPDWKQIQNEAQKIMGKEEFVSR